MPLHTVISHDPFLLLERAADGFLDCPRGNPSNPFPSPPYLLALRQGGLRDDLLRLAAGRGCPGWFDPPLCVFGELPQWLGGGGREPLDGVERLVLLERVVRRVGGVAAGGGLQHHLDALDGLVGELCAEGISPDAFARAMEGDGADGRDDFELARDAQLVAVHAAYMAELDAMRRRDGRDSIVDAAHALAADPDALARRLGGRREVRLVGLQDLRGGWRSLLSALATSPALDRVVVYTSLDLELGDFPVTVEDLRAEGTLASRLFATTTHDRLPQVVQGVQTPDAARAMEEVARRVRALCDSGVAPHRIAVVARDARPHMELAAGALGRQGVPVTLRRRLTLTEVPAVRALLTLLDAAVEGWTRHALVEVAEQPYLDAALDVQVVNTIGYRRQVRGIEGWQAAVAELHVEAERRERGEEVESEPWERGVLLPAAARIAEAREVLTRLAARAGRLDAERTLGEWLLWLRGVARDDAWGIEGRLMIPPEPDRLEIVRTDLAGWRRLGELVEAWHDAAGRLGAAGDVLTVDRFAAGLRRVLEGDVALWSSTGHGVQLLEAPAAAYRSFDHLFVVGMEGGGFPVRAPRSPLMGEWERERLVAAGLAIDPPSAWEARERELFRVLCAGAREALTLAWSSVDASGREVVRSTFVDDVEEVATLDCDEVPLSRVLLPGTPICPTPEVAAHARRVAAIERSRMDDEPSAWNGEVEDPGLLQWLAREFGEARVWSPTQLEAYARCPWAYFATRLLRIESPSEPGDGLEPTVRGRIVHRVLERVYERIIQERDGAPVLLKLDDAPMVEGHVARELDAALEEAAAAGAWLGDPALRAATRAELARLLRRYMEFEYEHTRLMHQNKGNKHLILRTGVVAHELHFDDVELDANGVLVRFRGSIDRVERGIDDRVEGADQYVAAVDYKSSTAAIPGGGDRAAWDDGVVLQVPIYARVLEDLYPGAIVSRMEYRTIRSAGVKLDLHLHQVRNPPTVEEHMEHNERMAAAIGAIGEHVKNVRTGHFPARPAPSCGCPRYCPAIDTCRVAGGPRFKGW